MSWKNVTPGPVPPPMNLNLWAAAPLQSQICKRVPLPVAPFGESRQRPDCGFLSEPFACGIHFWPPTPLQSHNSTCVPLAVPLPMISRQRPSVLSELLDRLYVQC